jgi:hypothetical protein
VASTIEELQKIVADESRSTEDREAAAQHILTLQGQPVEPTQQDRMAEQVSGLKAWFAKMVRDMEKQDGQSAELNAQAKKEPEPEVKSALPWYLQPAFLEEERNREELARAMPRDFLYT